MGNFTIPAPLSSQPQGNPATEGFTPAPQQPPDMPLLRQAATTPVVFPDGSRAMVPQERLHEALTADKGKMAQPVRFPDGSRAWVSTDQIHDAIAKDKGVVISMDEALGRTKPSVGQRIEESVKGLFSNIPTVPSPYPGGTQLESDIKQQVAQQSLAEDQVRQQEGHGQLYRLGAPIAEAAGSPVSTMEEGAREGDPNKVLGAAITGEGLAATPLAGEGAGVLRDYANHLIPARAAVDAAAETTAKVPRPDFLKPTDVLTETTPARIAELKTIPQKMEAVRQTVVAAEKAAKDRASAAFPKIEKPIQVGTETVHEPTGQADDFGEVTTPREQPTYTTFSDLQEQRSNTLADIADEKRLVELGAKPRYDLVKLYERLSTIDDLMNQGATAEGKMDQLTAARKQFKQYMDDFHNPGSPAKGVLEAKPGETAKVSGQLLSADNGARLAETLRRYGVSTSGIEDLLNQGSRPLKVSVNESAKLRKAGSDLAYKTQRYREAIRQTKVNELPSAAEARLPKGALGGKISNALGEVPGASIITPRRITGFRLQRALDALTGGTPEAPETPEAPKGTPEGGKPPQTERRQSGETGPRGHVFTPEERKVLDANHARALKETIQRLGPITRDEIITGKPRGRAVDILSGKAGD